MFSMQRKMPKLRVKTNVTESKAALGGDNKEKLSMYTSYLTICAIRSKMHLVFIQLIIIIYVTTKIIVCAAGVNTATVASLTQASISNCNAPQGPKCLFEGVIITCHFALPLSPFDQSPTSDDPSSQHKTPAVYPAGGVVHKSSCFLFLFHSVRSHALLNQAMHVNTRSGNVQHVHLCCRVQLKGWRTSVGVTQYMHFSFPVVVKRNKYFFFSSVI